MSWPSWLTYSGWLTHISGHPSAAGRAQDRESSPARDRRSTTEPRHQPCANILYISVCVSCEFVRFLVIYIAWSVVIRINMWVYVTFVVCIIYSRFGCGTVMDELLLRKFCWGLDVDFQRFQWRFPANRIVLPSVRRARIEKKAKWFFLTSLVWSTLCVVLYW